MYKIVAPIDKPITKIKVPSHLPKINPANNETGIPNPAMSTQAIVEIVNIKVSNNKLACFRPKK